jgi:DNA-binding CsgD family transcriptional regulator
MFLTSPNEKLFSDVLAVLLEEFGCQYGYIGFIDDSGDLVCPSMTRDVWNRCDVQGKSLVFPRSEWGGAWGRSLLEKRTCMENSDLHPPEGHLPLNNALVVPLLAEEELVGQIALANRQGGFDPLDRQRLEGLAGFLGSVLRIYLEKEKSAAKLKLHARDLEEKNIALKVLLENRQAEKRAAADGILKRFDQLVFPYFEKAREAERFEHMQTLLEIIETNTRESLASLSGTLPSAYRLLTALEVQVADLIKVGRTSKEIASILKITPRAVFFHRANIRRKFGLQNTKTNLRAHLASAG